MKNFPHQYNQLHLLRETLVTIRDLNEFGRDVSDDGVLGYELARRAVYSLRNFDGNIEARIAAEQAKPAGSQGARTAARELRRTLQYLSFLDSHLIVTQEGRQFLLAAEGSPEERATWHTALLDMAVPDQLGQVSHPIRILLRLVGHFGNLMREELALALEAADDTQAEFDRITGLIPLQDAIANHRLQVSEFQLANAVKILPALAEHTGLIARQGPNFPYSLTDAGRNALDVAFEVGPVAVGPRFRRAPARDRGGVRTLPPDPTIPRAPDDAAWNTLTADDQVTAIRLRFERTARHQATLRRLADLLRATFQLFEGTASFDLVALREAHPDESLVLFEIKSLEADAHTQARLAVGQLAYYEYFVVTGRWRGRGIRKAVVFDGDIDEGLAAFLDSLGVAAFECARDALRPLNPSGEELGRFLGNP